MPAKEPWPRLAKLWVACWICSGLVPGMSVFVDLFARAGVFGSICSPEDGTCDRQYMALSGTFNVANVATLFSLLPIGLVFDRYGAHACAVSGAALVFAGLALLQVPVLGAQSGCDAWTAWLFPIGVMVTDMGSLLNSQCTLGLVWHFPRRQSFVISLGNASYQAASLLPMLLQFLMQSLDFSLSSALASYMAAVAIAACVCHVHTPVQAEFFAEAKRALGIPLPPPPKAIDCLGVLRRGNEVLWRRFRDHRWVIFASSLGICCGMNYSSLSGDYGSKLFGSPDDGEHLADLYAVMNAVVGGAIAPLGIIFIDSLGIMSLIITLVVMNAGTFAFIAQPSWLAQAVVCFCSVGDMAVYLTFVTKYILIYAPPNRMGVVQGLLFAYALLFNAPIMLSFQQWMDMMPDGVERFSLPLFVASGLGLLGSSVYAVRSYLVGFPELPELLPEDEIELAKPFGCRNLDEVCYVTHTHDRHELLRALARGNVDAIRALVARVDADRMAEKLADMDPEDLAELVEAGPEAEEVDAEVELTEPYAENATLDYEACERGQLAEEMIDVAEAASTAPSSGLGGAGSDAEAPDRLRAESERVIGLIRAGDREAVKEAFLSVPVEDLWNSIVIMEERLDERERDAIERDFDRLIPPREFAALLRQRRELKTVVARMAKRKVRKMLGRKSR